jgi:sulfite reductase beta subunit-like hemoprotein
MPTARPAHALRHAGADHCPGVLVLHEAEDGRVARVRLPGGRIAARQLESIAIAARFGNGIVELTARANLQIRGLPKRAARPVAEVLTDVGLLPSSEHELVRNILASPLGGRHPAALAATDAIVNALDRELCSDASLAGLPGRFLFAVDDGSGLALGTHADVALIAEAAESFRVVLAGVPTTVLLAPGNAASGALDAARAFLELAAGESERPWRVGDLPAAIPAIAEALGGRALPGSPLPSAATLSPGLIVQQDGRVAVTALPPLARLDPDAIGSLRSLAERAGGDVRLSTSRTLTLCDIDAARGEWFTRALEAAGFVISPDSGWTGLSACAGLGACSKALLDVRAAAARRAALRTGSSPREHWSGCERRCGQPAGARIAIAARSAAQ